MSTELIEDGGPAFPSAQIDFRTIKADGAEVGPMVLESRGASLRDWFAGQALAMGEGVWPGGHLPENAGKIADKCYAIADAMIQRRKK